MDVRARRSSREISPDRARVCNLQNRVKPLRKVQVVYYLSRNGHLEHPHYMEVTHLPHHHLRLKDVMERLTVLRGRGMPSLYSWSCKRSYKNGYVWNDLAENDIIHPAEGAEYVLKGSELIEGCTEKFQQLHLSNRVQHIPEPNFHPKRHPLPRRRAPVEVENMRDEEQDYKKEEEEEEEEDEEKASYSFHSRCSRGVSTDEIEATQKNSNPTELALEDGSPPSTSSTVSDKANESNRSSKRFEDGDPADDSALGEPVLTRNSVLLQLIACGSMVSGKGKSVTGVKRRYGINVPATKNTNLHKGVLCKTAAKVAEEEDMINYISENPRFGNLQSEEKEYFSGSIVESMTEDRVSIPPVLKKSSSYNEERSSKVGLGEAVEEVEEKKEKAVKGKCIPITKFSGSSSRPSKK